MLQVELSSETLINTLSYNNRPSSLIWPLPSKPLDNCAGRRVVFNNGDVALVETRSIYRQGILSSLQSVLNSRSVQEFNSLQEFCSLDIFGSLDVFNLKPNYNFSALILTHNAVKNVDIDLLKQSLQMLKSKKIHLIFIDENHAGSVCNSNKQDMIELIRSQSAEIFLDDCCNKVFTRKIGDIFMNGNKNSPRNNAEKDPVSTLTFMQYKVLELIAEGLLNKQIAYRCSISEATVKSHASEVFRKLKIQRRSEAAVIYTKRISAWSINAISTNALSSAA